MSIWWQEFFDTDYLRLWEGAEPPEKTTQQVAGLWELMDLEVGCKVLDAPCGYGRIALEMARRGAEVVGLDLSDDLLAEAGRRHKQQLESTAVTTTTPATPATTTSGTLHLRYQKHDLRRKFAEAEFDVALNIFSSLGYGSEEDDIAMLTTLKQSVKPSGLVFIESIHRGYIEANIGQGPRPSERLEDGTLLEEEPHFCPKSGRVETTWKWSGPGGSGEKSASIRIYSAAEFESLIDAAGLQMIGQHDGCSPRPFDFDAAEPASRLGLLAQRPG
jgi:SAM-dependent methyltransferase